MGHDSAMVHLKLTVTRVQGKHDPQAWLQSGMRVLAAANGRKRTRKKIAIFVFIFFSFCFEYEQLTK
ncbi:hypothetical protein SUGI_1105530 [Cryptomeria japonica]|nr:hypothetical protein SUGI_1105530 [Cryptomeria japonica]